MYKLVGYSTGKAHTTDIVRAITDGNVLPIQSFNNSLPEAELIVISGILRGSGLVYKECVRQKRDFLFVDHAYFNKGYDHPTWMRVSKNSHSFGLNLTHATSERYEKFFATPFSPWGSKGNTILVMPPTHAISWLFDSHTWEKDTIAEIRKYTDRPIKVRAKPNNPIVDNYGNLLRIETATDIPLAADLENAYAAVIFNSNAAIECLAAGIPVIGEQYCPAAPISFSYADLETPMLEPNRYQLFCDLANAQFTKLEMMQGKISEVFLNN